MLEVFALCVALERRLHRLVVPVGEEDAPVGRGEGVVLPLGRGCLGRGEQGA